MKLLTPIFLFPKSSGLAIPDKIHSHDFCSSDPPLIADNRRCTKPGGCTGSAPANTKTRRAHGELPESPRGLRERDRSHHFDGRRYDKEKTTLDNSNKKPNQTASGEKEPDEQPTELLDEQLNDQHNKLVGYWGNIATIQPNNFKFKSLSNWSFNTAVGCGHACRFCYVPSASTKWLKPQLKALGVVDPDAQWGDYVYLREWDEEKFLGSLRKAEHTPPDELNPDGNRAVIYCSTTDPYQVFRHPDARKRRELAQHAEKLVRRSLELIRDESTLNVRILTRSPLARRDFDLYRSFGNRLVFGMSLPTLRNDLAKIYEPQAPAPSQRLKTLQEAKDAGLHVYVAMAPTYPVCEGSDLRDTLTAIRDLDPITIFHEPINIRAENVRRIEEHARSLGIPVKTDVFATKESWADYALHSLYLVEIIAEELGMTEHLHLWPDKSLGAKWMLKRYSDPQEQLDWLHHWWNRISEWPTGD